MTRARDSQGFLLVEGLLSMALFVGSLQAVLGLIQAGLARVAVERATLAADSMCHGALDRLASTPAELEDLLPPAAGSGPRTTRDPAMADAGLGGALGANRARVLLEPFGGKLVVTLVPARTPGLARLTCSVHFTHPGRGAVPRDASYSCLVVHGG